MVNPEELRIGNYIRYEEEGFFLVRRIGRDDIEGVWISDGVTTTENDPPEAFEPIPLTPELLEKAGFDVSFWGYTKAGFPFSIWHYEGKEEMLVQYNKTEEEICYITYLHELQNLYHSITGKELEIAL